MFRLFRKAIAFGARVRLWAKSRLSKKPTPLSQGLCSTGDTGIAARIAAAMADPHVPQTVTFDAEGRSVVAASRRQDNPSMVDVCIHTPNNPFAQVPESSRATGRTLLTRTAEDGTITEVTDVLRVDRSRSNIGQ